MDEMAQKRISVASDHHTNLLISIGWVIGTAGGACAVGRWATTLGRAPRPRRAGTGRRRAVPTAPE
jgi:hypothetical protein